MSDDTMPKRIKAGYGVDGREWNRASVFTNFAEETEYIRADVARDELNQALADGDLTQHKLDKANARIAELEYMMGSAPGVAVVAVEQLEAARAIIKERDARIAKLEKALRDLIEYANAVTKEMEP